MWGAWLLVLARLATGSPVGSRRGQIPFKPGPSLVLLEGDMAVQNFLGDSEAGHTFIRGTNNLWVNGVVFYRFDTFQ
jgi:hypothetical protein